MIEWRQVPGLSRYEATACGLVRSVGRMVHIRGSFWREGKILAPSMHRNGRYSYCLRDDDGASCTVSPQRITWLTFIGSIPDGYAVTLIDNDKPASVDNCELRWSGIRPVAYRQPKPKAVKPRMEGYCSLIGEFLRMRYT
jgi:uncharacterized protein YbdZ (MbtH family)